MKRFGKKLGILIVAMALLVTSAFSVSAATAVDNQVALDFANGPTLSSRSMPSRAYIYWYRHNGYCMNVYSSSSTPANFNKVTTYAKVAGDPLQQWSVDGNYNDTQVRIHCYGTNFCVDCGANNYAQIYSSNSSTTNVNDQYLKLVDERQSTGKTYGCGFVLTRTISSTPLALWADESDTAGLVYGFRVKFGSPTTATQSAYYWYMSAA